MKPTHVTILRCAQPQKQKLQFYCLKNMHSSEFIALLFGGATHWVLPSQSTSIINQLRQDTRNCIALSRISARPHSPVALRPSRGGVFPYKPPPSSKNATLSRQSRERERTRVFLSIGEANHLTRKLLRYGCDDFSHPWSLPPVATDDRCGSITGFKRSSLCEECRR